MHYNPVWESSLGQSTLHWSIISASTCHHMNYYAADWWLGGRTRDSRPIKTPQTETKMALPFKWAVTWGRNKVGVPWGDVGQMRAEGGNLRQLMGEHVCACATVCGLLDRQKECVLLILKDTPSALCDHVKVGHVFYCVYDLGYPEGFWDARMMQRSANKHNWCAQKRHSVCVCNAKIRLRRVCWHVIFYIFSPCSMKFSSPRQRHLTPSWL